MATYTAIYEIVPNAKFFSEESFWMRSSLRLISSVLCLNPLEDASRKSK